MGVLLIVWPDGAAAQSAGSVFRDCADCPEMVAIPAGSFFMGSPKNENGHLESESPVHRVRIARPFALGRYAVTFDEWGACVAGGGCSGYHPADKGWGRGRRPVINVSWNDAQTYVQWLSRKTGKSYRLPAESEWEYAARAGTTTARFWGDAIGRNNANCDGCGSQWDNKQTAPVGSFAPNRFGLYDMVGNVGQWMADCNHYTYSGAPSDGLAWTSGDCSSRVLRGCSWYGLPDSARSAFRGWNASGNRHTVIGFRVARTITP